MFREMAADLWEVALRLKADAVCITTNGTVRSDGACVMGRGCAREALERFPGIGYRLGEAIRRFGQGKVISLGHPTDRTGKEMPYILVSFPVKHNWWEKADLSLIERSARILAKAADEKGWRVVVMPRPGCGNGGRKWEEVKPILQRYLDERFVIVRRPARG